MVKNTNNEEKGHKEKGFTLVELAIVLVIIGLIVGGVLAGQTLIRNAEVRAVINERNQMETAVNTFRLRYKGLPGDIRNATAYWGAADPARATCFTIDSGGKETCDGNGDGRIGDPNAVDPLSPYEMYRVWQHLGNAELVPGTYSGVFGPAGPYDTVPGGNAPGSKLDANAVWALHWQGVTTGAPWMFNGNYSHVLQIGSLVSGAGMGLGWIPYGPIVPVTEAMSLDQKLDDGNPGRGMIRAFAPISAGTPFDNDCATSNDPLTATYDLTSSGCAMMFILKL